MHNPGQNGRPAYAPRRPIRVSVPAVYWIVCQSVAVVRTHWDGTRTLECVRREPSDPCPGCIAEHPPRLEHWLLVQDERARARPNLLYLTNGAAEKAVALWKHDGNLWGRAVLVSRLHARWNGPMSAVIIDRTDAPRLVEPRDPLTYLRKMWGAPTKVTTAYDRARLDAMRAGANRQEGGERC